MTNERESGDSEETLYALFVKQWTLGEIDNPEAFIAEYAPTFSSLNEGILSFVRKWRISPTFQLLTRWHEGDEEAFNRLIEQHYEWLLRKVRLKLIDMDPIMRNQGEESSDYVQQALMDFLKAFPAS